MRLRCFGWFCCERDDTNDGDGLAEKGEEVAINQYTLHEQLGRGAFGKVLRCHDGHTSYAVKVFSKALLRRRKVVQGASMSNYYHKVIDDCCRDGLFIVMEYAEHGSLGRALTDTGQTEALMEDQALRYFRGMVAAVNYIHECRIMHRDIKPENWLLDKNDVVKLADFGVSQRWTGEDDLVDNQTGTPAFLPPEACRGAGAYSGRAADVWGLGATLYVLVCGTLPFEADTVDGTLALIANTPLRFPSRAQKEMSPWLLSCLRGMMCADPKLRLILQAVERHPWLSMA